VNVLAEHLVINCLLKTALLVNNTYCIKLIKFACESSSSRD